MRTPADWQMSGDPTNPSVRRLRDACAATALAAALFSAEELPGRLLVTAAAVCGYAAVVPDLRAAAAVSLVATTLFDGFLANRYGELAVHGGAVWWYALVILFAAVLGTGYRRMRGRSG